VTVRDRRISYAAAEPSLRSRMPESLKQTAPARATFEEVKNRFRETKPDSAFQRRDEQGSGSAMVKRHRPQPQLRPRHHLRVLRMHFNRAWEQERESAAVRQPVRAEPGIGGGR